MKLPPPACPGSACIIAPATGRSSEPSLYWFEVVKIWWVYMPLRQMEFRQTSRSFLPFLRHHPPKVWTWNLKVAPWNRKLFWKPSYKESQCWNTKWNWQAVFWTESFLLRESSIFFFHPTRFHQRDAFSSAFSCQNPNAVRTYMSFRSSTQKTPKTVQKIPRFLDIE